jgi:signal transduction histidine kinase/CheY-like chemotaxis protein
VFLYILLTGNLVLYGIGECYQSLSVRLVGLILLVVQSLLLLQKMGILGSDLQSLVEGKRRSFKGGFLPGLLPNYVATLSGISKRLEWADEIVMERTPQKQGVENFCGDRYLKFSDVCGDLIRDLRELRGPLEYGVVWRDSEGSQYLSSQGDSSRVCMVKNLLEVWLQSLASEPGSTGHGVMRLDRSDFLGRLLTLQGFETASWWQLGSQAERVAYLWVGYGEYVGMSLLEKQVVAQAIERFRFNLTAVAHFSVLSDRVEEASLMSQRKDAFLSHFSHDVRTPLNNIMMVVRMLRSDKGTATRHELYEMILSSCKRINQQIEEALDYSRSEAGELNPHAEILNLGEISADIERSWTHAFADKGLTFEVNFDEELSVVCDRRHLHRIIDNLVSNGLKYTDVGGVTVDGYESKRGQVIRIDVSDTGVGFTPEEKSRVFTPFERFGKHEVEGVGLGLSVTRSLVERNGGVIFVQSEAHSGTIVTVELPRFLPEAQVDGTVSVRKSNNPLVGLVIEDDPDFRSLMSCMLAARGIKVLEACSVREAQRMVEESAPAFMIADYSIPGGFDQLERVIQSLERNIRIAVMSGYCLHGKVNAAYRVFRKPFDIDELVVWVQSKEDFKV